MHFRLILTCLFVHVDNFMIEPITREFLLYDSIYFRTIPIAIDLGRATCNIALTESKTGEAKNSSEKESYSEIYWTHSAEWNS